MTGLGRLSPWGLASYTRRSVVLFPMNAVNLRTEAQKTPVKVKTDDCRVYGVVCRRPRQTTQRGTPARKVSSASGTGGTRGVPVSGGRVRRRREQSLTSFCPFSLVRTLLNLKVTCLFEGVELTKKRKRKGLPLDLTLIQGPSHFRRNTYPSSKCIDPKPEKRQPVQHILYK